MKESNYPPRVLLVLAPVFVVAFFLLTSLAGELTKMATPYLVFGTAGRDVTVLHFHRHLVTFSNGTLVSGSRLLPVDAAWGLLSLTFLLLFYFLCRWISERMAGNCRTGLARDVSDFLRFSRQ